jgi:hypothetical protein
LVVRPVIGSHPGYLPVLSDDVSGTRFTGADPVCGCAIDHPVAEDHRDFLTGTESERNGLGEQASHRKDFLAGILEERGHDDSQGAALRENPRQRGGSFFTQRSVTHVRGQSG